MQKWEYLVVTIRTPDDPWVDRVVINGKKYFEAKGKNRPHLDDYQAELYTQLGQEGWELVSVIQYVTAYFKRLKE